MEAAVTLIQTLGFPIACVIALGFFVYKIYLTEKEEGHAREERLYAQLDKFSDSLTNFNATLIKIDTRLSIIEDYYLNNKHE